MVFKNSFMNGGKIRRKRKDFNDKMDYYEVNSHQLFNKSCIHEQR